MSIHISTDSANIAQTVLLPGDPLRAKYIAEKFLTDAICYNDVRGMLGYTGIYKGKLISVQGTGMGMPSMSIYATELIKDYGVKNLIRVGTCGSFKEEIKIRDIIFAIAASTDSNINKIHFNGCDFAPAANFELLRKSYDLSLHQNVRAVVGTVFSTDTFYTDDDKSWHRWADYGCIAVEMETAALYTIAAKFNAKALSILTVSDHLLTGEITTSEDREKSFNNMLEIGLETAITL